MARKGKYNFRNPAGTSGGGQFRRLSDHGEIPLGLGTHSGAVLPALKRALGLS
jgi:hypothetical protein